MTSIGYPDKNILKLLNSLYRTDKKLTFFGLTDADLYGLEILSIFWHGSYASAPYNNYLAVPTINWLGAFPEDIKLFNHKTST